ncbi:MAG: H-NS histone family protein [Hyphomicrobiaceae bacterium]|nr:H-NS histone family protein [Hyphomicrobiaceae bacterium]
MEKIVARTPNLEKFSYSELLELRAEIDAVLVQKQAEEKAVLKQKLADMAKERGFDLDEVLGRGRKRGAVPVKYRDPKNPENTWTGRGRMPRWLAAATKARGVKKEDFLV